MDDAAILGGLDGEPEAFAVLYRRHVGGLLEYFFDRTHGTQQSADLTAETFAAALQRADRFDPARETARAWLYAIADRLLDRAVAGGVVEQRARRRLGLAPLRPGDRFVAELEEELVAAARFRAARRARRIALPRVPVRALIAGAAAAVLAAIAALALSGGGGGDQERASERRSVLPPAATQVVLVPTHPLATCVQPTTESLTNGAPIEGITLLRRAQAEADTIPFSPTRLPIGSFDPAATRRPAQGQLGSTVHVVPSSHVATDGDCGVHERPGACIVLDRRRFACFGSEEVSVGRALVRGRHGSVVGIAPDGIDRVTISGTDAPVGADVVENVYEAHLADAPGSRLTLSFHRSAADGCERDVSRALLARVSALRADPVPAIKLPRVVLDVLGDSQLDAIVDAGARYWGESAGVDFWVVPVVPLGEPECAPASSACVVAVVEAGRRADAECVLAEESGRDAWRLAPLLSGRAAIYGVVPDGIIGARVTIGGRTAEAAARDNVVAGVLPFGYGDPARTEVELIRHPPAPVIGVVDASRIRGVAENLRARIRKAGYATVGAIRTSPQPQPHTEVYWWPEGTRPSEAERVSDLLRADLHRIEPDRMPRPVRETRAPIVVVVGSEP